MAVVLAASLDLCCQDIFVRQSQASTSDEDSPVATGPVLYFSGGRRAHADTSSQGRSLWKHQMRPSIRASRSTQPHENEACNVKKSDIFQASGDSEDQRRFVRSHASWPGIARQRLHTTCYYRPDALRMIKCGRHISCQLIYNATSDMTAREKVAGAGFDSRKVTCGSVHHRARDRVRDSTGRVCALATLVPSKGAGRTARMSLPEILRPRQQLPLGMAC